MKTKRGLIAGITVAGVLVTCIVASVVPAQSAASSMPAPAGACASPPSSNLGCEFYAVTLPNQLIDQNAFSFGVALLNSGTASVTVTITGGLLGAPQVFDIAAQSSVVRILPWVTAASQSIATTRIAGGAYRIRSTGPLSALQLNPAQSGSDSSDASLLLPVSTAGTSYQAVVWPTWGYAVAGNYPGNIAIVATAPSTTVQVIAAGGIQPGAGLGANGGTVVLDMGEMLLIASALDAGVLGYGSDLSGTRIVSDQPILVWTGHAGAFIDPDTGFADHLEESLLPTSALDREYFIVRPGDATGTGTGTRHMVKLVGTVDGTALVVQPAIAGVPTALNAGQAAVFEAAADFHLQASHPLVVGTFMEGSQTVGFTGGDPSQSMPIGTSRAAASSDFTAPSDFAPVWAQLVAPTGSTITVDGALVSNWTAIGATGYSVARASLCCTDAHRAVGNQPFLLSVHAYPAAGGGSFWYPAYIGPSDVIFDNGFE